MPAPHDVDDLARVADALRDVDVEIDEIALRRPTLDDAFLALTGQPAEQLCQKMTSGLLGPPNLRSHTHERLSPSNEPRPATNRFRHAPPALRAISFVRRRCSSLAGCERFPRVPTRLSDVTIQPIMFTLLFLYVFGSAIHIPDMTYQNYLLPGLSDRAWPLG